MPVEWWVVFATLAGPVLAVQTQKWIERASEGRRQRVSLFTALMANRATRLADDYVRALNLIDLVFLPKWWWFPEKDRAVIRAWRALLDELNHGPGDGETDRQIIAMWNTRCSDRLVDLLAAMSKALGYNFTNEELRRGIYHPMGHVEREQSQLAILHGLRKILEGSESLRMKVTEVPASPEGAELQRTLNEKMAKAYDENGSLRVRIEDGGGLRKRG
jgi:hypothetical protein